MKPVHPKRFYATEWAMADPACVARMERLMQGFGQPMDKIEVLTEDDVEPTIRDRDWADLDVRQGRVDFQGDPDVVFNKFRWLAPEDITAIRERHPIFSDATGYTHGMVRTLYGFPDFNHFEDGHRKREVRDNCCWSLYDLHSARGCFHKCQYCRRGRVTTLMLDIEEWLEHVDDLLAKAPWQKVIRYDVETDCLPLEPEYGMCRALVEHFSQKPDRYIILFSKSDNVDFLLDLEHRGHTIMLWTLSTPTVSRRVEIDTATTEERIEAARKCQAAGYTVRFKFKPIVPIANWREEATDMLEKLFAKVRPDNLSMETLFFNTTAELKGMIDPSLFDPAFLDMMEKHEAAGGITDVYRTIPPDFRGEVYEYYADEVKRLSPETPLSLCAESHAMWERLAPRLGQTGTKFVCNCGPACIPGATGDRIRSDDGAIAIID